MRKFYGIAIAAIAGVAGVVLLSKTCGSCSGGSCGLNNGNACRCPPK